MGIFALLKKLTKPNKTESVSVAAEADDNDNMFSCPLMNLNEMSEWNLSAQLMAEMRQQHSEMADFMSDPDNWSASGRESAF